MWIDFIDRRRVFFNQGRSAYAMMKKQVWFFVISLTFSLMASPLELSAESSGSAPPLIFTSPFPSVENKNVGRMIPSFKLKIISGEEVDLETLRAGKKMIMFFWATWCPHCRETLKDLETRIQEFKQKDISLILVNLGEKQNFVKKFLEKNNIPLDTFLDEESILPEIYGLSGVPAFFLVNKRGIVNLFVYNNLPKDYNLVLDYQYP